MFTTLIAPGLRSSGPNHWQTWLEKTLDGAVRVQQSNWNDAHLPNWSQRIRREISRAPTPVVIVGHSFGALAAVQAAHDHADNVQGLLIVAPADPEKFGVADNLPTTPLPFPTILVASANDPWMEFSVAARWAETWSAELINLGAAGHVNADSGFGPWPLAIQLVEQLRAVARPSARASQAASKAEVDRAARLLLQAGWRVSAPS
ncbi:MAG: RBBP9/YdeN family alpha/beta hydrolase [Hyphomicrobium sp.]